MARFHMGWVFRHFTKMVINAEQSRKRHTELLTMNVTEDWAGRGGKMNMRFLQFLLPQSLYFDFLTISMNYFLNKKYFQKFILLKTKFVMDKEDVVHIHN